MTTELELKLDSRIITANVACAIEEDIGSGDISSALISPDKIVEAEIISREDIILCGVEWANAVFRLLDKACILDWQAADGERVEPNARLAIVKGSARALLAAERVALNFLQTLSATATLTRRFSQLLLNTRVTLLDTRKTVPGLRYAQKYAVRCGGGHNHRMGLYDVYLLKENHRLAFDSLAQAVATAREKQPDAPLIVEVESIEELKEALRIGDIDRVLLDNFSLDDLREAVSVAKGRIPLEVSGNVSLHNITRIAKTGVDYISVGSLTKHIYAVDLSMRFLELENNGK